MQGTENKEISIGFLKLAEDLYRRFQKSLPAYSNKFSPQKFTCAQIRALICLQAMFGLERELTSARFQGMSEQELGRLLQSCGLVGPSSFRGITNLVRQSDELRRALELRKSPHYSTLFRAAARLQGEQ